MFENRLVELLKLEELEEKAKSHITQTGRVS